MKSKQKIRERYAAMEAELAQWRFVASARTPEEFQGKIGTLHRKIENLMADIGTMRQQVQDAAAVITKTTQEEKSE